MVATPHPTAPGLQARCGNFGKAPVAITLDTSLSDGAARLYSHMHAKYDRQGYLTDNRAELAEPLGISPTTVTKRLGELIARNWIVVIEQVDRRGRTANAYHVFEIQQECIKWKVQHSDLPYAKIAPPTEARKLRRSTGGKPCHHSRLTQVDPPVGSLTQVHQPLGELTQVDPPSELEFTNLVNLSSPPLYIETDSNTDKTPEEKTNTLAATSAAGVNLPDALNETRSPDEMPPVHQEALPTTLPEETLPTPKVPAKGSPPARRRYRDYPFKRAVSEQLAGIPFDAAEDDKRSMGWVSTIASRIIGYEQRQRGLTSDISSEQYQQLAADVERFGGWYDAANPGLSRPTDKIIKYWSEWDRLGRSTASAGKEVSHGKFNQSNQPTPDNQRGAPNFKPIGADGKLPPVQ